MLKEQLPTKEKMSLQESYEKMEGLINELQNKSQYQHEQLSETRKRIFTAEGQEFFIDRETDPKSPRVKRICDFIGQFDPEERDIEEITKNVHDDRYGYFVADDREGKIIGCLQSSHIELLDRRNEVLLFIGHVIIDKNQQRQGLGNELYIAAYQKFLDKAIRENQIPKAITGEGETKVEMEEFFNGMGRKRMYFEDGKGNVHEVPYIQPPLQWDKESGRPIDPRTGKVAEKEDIEKCSAKVHLMVRNINGNEELTTDEVLSIVDSIYEDNYAGKDVHGSPENPAVEEELNRLKQELKEALLQSKDGRVYFMSKEEREQKREALAKQGKSLSETIDSSMQ